MDYSIVISERIRKRMSEKTIPENVKSFVAKQILQ